jgi:hypothetical protein
MSSPLQSVSPQPPCDDQASQTPPLGRSRFYKSNESRQIKCYCSHGCVRCTNEDKNNNSSHEASSPARGRSLLSRPSSLPRTSLMASHNLISRRPRRPSRPPNRTPHTNRDRRPRHPRPRLHPALARATPHPYPPLRLHDLARSLNAGRDKHHGSQRGIFGLPAASGPVFS